MEGKRQRLSPSKSNDERRQLVEQEKKEAQLNNYNPEIEGIDERITKLEQDLADIGHQLNSNITLGEEEMRKFKPEFEEIRTQIKLVLPRIKEQIEQLSKEKENLEQQKERLERFKRRLGTADEKFVDFSDEVNKPNYTISNINELPDEHLINIFSYLSQNELGEVARVCRKWNVLTKSSALWKMVDVEFDDKHGSQNTVTQCFISSLRAPVTRMKISFIRSNGWNGKLNFEELCVGLSERCPHLETLILFGAQLSNSFPSVIDLCTEFLHDLKDLKDLRFIFSEFSEGSETKSCSEISKLEILELYMCLFGHLNYHSMIKHTISKMPKLKELYLSGLDVNDSFFVNNDNLSMLNILEVGYSEISSTAFAAIKNHGFNLKKLYLCDSDLSEIYLNLDGSMFPHLETICLKTGLVKLEFIISIIRSLQSLKIVYIDEHMAELCASHPYIVANQCKREIVKFVHDCLIHKMYHDY